MARGGTHAVPGLRSPLRCGTETLPAPPLPTRRHCPPHSPGASEKTVARCVTTTPEGWSTYGTPGTSADGPGRKRGAAPSRLRTHPVLGPGVPRVDDRRRLVPRSPVCRPVVL